MCGGSTSYRLGDTGLGQGCIQKFCQGEANLGYGQKRGGGGSLCGVLHPTLAGGENDTRGGKCPSPPPPLKYSLVGDRILG